MPWIVMQEATDKPEDSDGDGKDSLKILFWVG